MIKIFTLRLNCPSLVSLARWELKWKPRAKGLLSADHRELLTLGAFLLISLPQNFSKGYSVSQLLIAVTNTYGKPFVGQMICLGSLFLRFKSTAIWFPCFGMGGQQAMVQGRVDHVSQKGGRKRGEQEEGELKRRRGRNRGRWEREDENERR